MLSITVSVCAGLHARGPLILFQRNSEIKRLVKNLRCGSGEECLKISWTEHKTNRQLDTDDNTEIKTEK